MKGMGTYTPFERKLSTLSIDEVNELYLSGKLDTLYDEFETTKIVPSFNKKSLNKSIAREVN